MLVTDIKFGMSRFKQNSNRPRETRELRRLKRLEHAAIKAKVKWENAEQKKLNPTETIIQRHIDSLTKELLRAFDELLPPKLAVEEPKLDAARRKAFEDALGKVHSFIGNIKEKNNRTKDQDTEKEKAIKTFLRSLNLKGSTGGAFTLYRYMLFPSDPLLAFPIDLNSHRLKRQWIVFQQILRRFGKSSSARIMSQNPEQAQLLIRSFQEDTRLGRLRRHLKVACKAGYDSLLGIQDDPLFRKGLGFLDTALAQQTRANKIKLH